MANISEAFPSAFLKAEDLQGRSVNVVINSAAIEELGKGRDKDTKIVISLVGKSKKFVCNKTNARVIASLYGPETDDWAGQPITLVPREVEFQGDMVLALRVSLTLPPAAKAAPAPEPAPAKKAAAPAPATNLDEDVPFN